MKKNQKQTKSSIKFKKGAITSKKFSPLSTEQTIWLYGKNSVFLSISAKRRKIYSILSTQAVYSEIQEFLSKNNLQQFQQLVKIVDKKHLQKILGEDVKHQGLVALCSNLPTYDQDDLINNLKESDGLNPHVIILDQIVDPQNAGAIIRSAVAFGVRHIVICFHNSAKDNAAISKTSAGNIELANLYLVNNLSDLMLKLKKIDYWCIGLDGCAKDDITKLQDFKKIALIVGSEGKGIRQLVKKNCDLLTKINIDKQVESLNAAVAASIALHEITKF